MRKLKNALMILLTLLLLAAGSLLPMAAAYVQDKTAANTVQYADIEALQLTLEEEALSMTYQEKMFLMMNGMGMEVKDANTQIKEKQILEAAYAALTPYLDLFLGGSFDNDYLEYTPVMVYDENDPSRYCYYWHVMMSLDVSINDSVSVILDDETGKILALEMIDPDFNIDTEYLWELQSKLAAMYFEDLRIEPVAEWPLETEAVDEIAATGNALVSSRYQFVDTVYGEVNVEIGVRTDGFYIYIA